MRDKFKDVNELYIVYISEFDFIKGEKTIYHVDKTIRETSQVIDDGLHEIYVNTVIDDGSNIAALMSCFTKKEVNNPKFPKLSAEVKRLKTTEGGARAVCEVMEKYISEEVIKTTAQMVSSLMQSMQMTFDDAVKMLNLSEDVKAAIAPMVNEQ